MTEDEDRSLRIMKRSPLNAYLQVEREMLTLETTIHDTAENFTKPVLTALCKAGRYFDYTVWASRVDDEHRNGGGWLYDVTWCEKVLIGQVLCFLHGCGCPTKIRGNVGDGFVGVLSINRHDLWEFDPDGYNILSRTRFPWTQNWLNRSVQGGPEHDR